MAPMKERQTSSNKTATKSGKKPLPELLAAIVTTPSGTISKALEPEIEQLNTKDLERLITRLDRATKSVKEALAKAKKEKTTPVKRKKRPIRKKASR